MRSQPAVLLVTALVTAAHPVQAQALNGSWVWCEPRDPLTYFIDPSAATWAPAVNRAAAAWTAATPWNLPEAGSADAARIVIRTARIDAVMQALINQTHHRGDFRVTAWGYVEISGLRKPCAEQAEIRFWIDPAKPPVNEQNTAMHEFGHALGLNDNDVRTDIMFSAEQNLMRLSPADIGSATESSGRSNLNQLHRLVTPLPDGSSLAFGGVEILIPGGALDRPSTFGIRPLSPTSLLVAELPADRVLAAAQVGPEWSVDETEGAGPYVQKQVPLALPATVVFRLARDAASGVLATDGFALLNADRPAIDVATIRIASIASDGAQRALETRVEEDTGQLLISASVLEFGIFAVIADETTPARVFPRRWVVLATGLMALVLLLYLLLGRGARRTESG